MDHVDEENYSKHGYGPWSVETLDGRFVRDCGLTWQEVNGVPKLEVGYHVAAESQGRGYATEAALACRDYEHDAVETPELVAIVHPDNEASERVARKLGMHIDSTTTMSSNIPVRTALGMNFAQRPQTRPRG